MKAAFLAVVAACFAMATPALAQSQTSTDTVYETVSTTDMNTILQGMGFQSVAQVGGANTFEVHTTNGFVFNLFLVACDGPGNSCYGIEMSTSWDMEASQATLMANTAASFNGHYSLLKAFTEPNHLRVQRYVITDGGVTAEHLRQEVRVFLSGTRFFTEYVKQQTNLQFPAP